MSAASELKAHLSLTNVLLFQSLWIKWIFFLGLGLSVFGGTLIVVWDHPITKLVASLGGLIAAVSIFFMMLVLPGQILSVNSSKQVSVLPRIKNISSRILFLFGLGFALVSSLLAAFMDKPVIFSHLFLAFFFITSCFLILSLVIGHYWQWAQFTVSFMIIVSPHVLTWLQSLNVFLMIFLNFLLWACFTVWWRAWRPKKFFRNVVLMTQTEMASLHLRNRYSGAQGKIISDIQTAMSGFENPITTRMDAMRTCLMGSNLNALGRAKSALLVIAFFSIFVLVSFLLSGSQRTIQVFGGISYLIIFVIYTTLCQTVLLNTYRHLPRIWLICQGSRPAIFSLLEKLYFSAASALVFPVLIIHLMLCFLYPQVFFVPAFAVLIFIFAVILVLFMFYLNIVFYVYSRLGISLANWVNVAIGIISTLAIFVAGFNWLESTEQVVNYSVMMIAIASISIVALRAYAIRVWPRVNFVRVAQ